MLHNKQHIETFQEICLAYKAAFVYNTAPMKRLIDELIEARKNTAPLAQLDRVPDFYSEG